MPQNANKDSWAAAHPRQAVQIIVFILVSLLHFPVAVLGLILFILFNHLLRIKAWFVLGYGCIVPILGLFHVEYAQGFHIPLITLLQQMQEINIKFVRYLITSGTAEAFQFLYDTSLFYLLSLPVFLAGIFGMLELIPNSSHEKELKAIQRSRKNEAKEISNPNRLNSLINKLDEQNFNGTLLGLSKRTQKAVVIPDDAVNQVALVLGTTGGGKTITLRRFYQRALMQGYPLIIVDGKPTNENVQWVQNYAERCRRQFYGFNCGYFNHYDCLNEGGYTELKDKIISLKDEWESDYYRSIAEDYLQTTFEVLIQRREKKRHFFDLKAVVECLDYEELALLVRETEDEKLMNRVKRLGQYERKDITGLQAHLNLLIHSELGQYFDTDTLLTFSLTQAIQHKAVVYFALPALRFPAFSKVLGKLVINDIKAVIDRVSHPRIFTIFDEFSIFAGEQVLNLVNMGRGKGVHAIFGTQGVADLQRIDKAFANQVLNCVNTVICHRLNDQESAEAIAGWVGTRDSFDLTAQISSEQGSTGAGSVRRNKEFIVHPDEIKQALQPGEAFYITKVGQFQQDKIKVKYS